MTQTTPTLTVPAARKASPHTQPAVAAAIGVAVGVLTVLEGFFGSGHIPSGAEVASILAGAGVTLGSVGAFIAHHASWLRAVGPAVAADFPVVEDAVKLVPGLAERLGAVEHAVQEQVAKVAPAVDVAALAGEVKQLIVGDAVKPAAAQAAPVVATPAAG